MNVCVCVFASKAIISTFNYVTFVHGANILTYIHVIYIKPDEILNGHLKCVHIEKSMKLLTLKINCMNNVCIWAQLILMPKASPKMT